MFRVFDMPFIFFHFTGTVVFFPARPPLMSLRPLTDVRFSSEISMRAFESVSGINHPRIDE